MVESNLTESPIIVAFTSDLMSTVRIRSLVEHLGFQLMVVESASQGRANRTTSVNPPQAEPVEGPEATLFDNLTRWSPVLTIIDLGDDRIPWRDWLIRLKSSPATRRLPVVCYGPHVHADILKEAKQLAANYVVSRSRFFSDLPSIIEKYARSDDARLVEESCQKLLPAIAEKGLEAFNRGQYFDAHEHLEDAWNADQSAGRDFYRALIQVAVAYLQIERSNYRGAYKMLLRSRQWFRPLPESCRGVEMKILNDDAEAVYQALVRLGPDRIREFDRSLLRPVQFTSRDYG